MSDDRQTPKTCWLAVASFWLAIITALFTWVFKVFCRCQGLDPIPVLFVESIAFVMGLAALLLIRRSRGTLVGSGWAYAGIIVSLGWSAYTLYSHQTYSIRMQRTSCLNNMMQIGMAAAVLYPRDHDGKLPASTNWNPQTLQYLPNKRVITCPILREKREWCYAMNAKVSGLRLEDIANPSEMVMFFESVPGRDLAGGANLFPRPPRHRDGYPVLFCDGKVRVVPESEIGSLVWQPRMKGREERVPRQP